MLKKERMSHPVVTVHPEMPIMDALNLMKKEGIRRLPVVDKRGRLACLVPHIPGELAQLTKAIFDAGGNVLTLGTFLGESSENREITLKVDGITPQSLEIAIEPFVERILDIRESPLS